MSSRYQVFLPRLKQLKIALVFSKKNGTTSGFENRSSFNDYKDIIGIKKYQELEKEFIKPRPPQNRNDSTNE